MAKLKRKYTIAWVGMIVWFAAWEGFAVFNAEPGDTLSEHVWWMLGAPVVTYAGLGAFIWLGLHFFRRANWRP